ncbi:mitochondrial dicarboxylate carrier-like isoform X1 [Drosophila sulfurigaster albostrigata]|uniref:mitochondrial dicarboxylate carrier-like isoform X1 n=1 Tax=Drosophila sulfurigaster albostrigata TaxID=89887 RepID=UPI002D218DD0|nr:mitochondrial dicarboxylate carrier-like isoform X1 [Drosophila sulfurigaster albostrigata]
MATEKYSRWYFGGLASTMAASLTHPLDTLKVNLQTQQAKMSILELVLIIFRQRGLLGFYRGISAAVMRQLTYSMSRFGAYEIGKDYVNTETFAGKVGLAGVCGVLGGVIGAPADMINVRMQNDVKLPPEKRRNYKHAFDGLTKAYRQEGIRRLFTGGTIAAFRGGLITIGQLAFYDQIKSLMLSSSYFNDNSVTHFTASLLAGITATTLTQPVDVLKTRIMNAKPGDFTGLMDIIRYTAELGPKGFFRGYVPALVRIVPLTILTFMFLEQLRLHFGYEKIKPIVYKY